MADCAELNSIELTKLFNSAVRQSFAGPFISFAAEIELGKLDLEIEFVSQQYCSFAL